MALEAVVLPMPMSPVARRFRARRHLPAGQLHSVGQAVHSLGLCHGRARRHVAGAGPSGCQVESLIDRELGGHARVHDYHL